MFKPVAYDADPEARYIVDMLDAETFKYPAQVIVQGYLKSVPLNSLRVRIENYRRAIFTRQSSWDKRRIRAWRLPLWLGYVLLSLCRGRVVYKTRYHHLFWRIDVFSHELKGLVTAECKLKDQDRAMQELPRMHLNKDVSSWLNNQHLASLVNELHLHPVRGSIRQYICERFMPSALDD